MKERTLIEKIKREYGHTAEYLLKGIGDDCAVFAETQNMCWLVSTDLLAEDVHFSLKWHDPYLLGRKTVAVNLSDIAAMGGEPKFALLSIALPAYISDSWLNSWQAGVRSMLDEYNCLLIGGDTAKGSTLFINVTILGTAVPGEVTYRSGATVGNDIYVSGPLGLAAAGLELCKRGITDRREFSQLYKAHLDPQPQVRLGTVLGKSGKVLAMQDISDGISTDLSHICKESGVGAVLLREKLPFTKELEMACTNIQLDKYAIILHGGEDYQLVFTAEKDNRKRIEELFDHNQMPLFRVGYTRDQPGVYLIDDHNGESAITFAGFEHST